MKGAGSLFKRTIRYIYQQVFSEFAQKPVTQVASEKVASTVATFLNFDS